jgi:hypothetical protein
MIGDSPTVHRFTREKLYDLVWSESMSNLAARLGLSDRGLAKACARANVPVPGRGYWAKLQNGAKVDRSPLPPAAAGAPEIFEVRRGLRKSDLPPLPPEVVEEMAKESTPDRKIVVPKDLSRSHPIVRALLEAGQGEAQHGAIGPHGVTLPRRRVTTSERRRMRIVSALLKALEARGHKVVADPEDHRHLAVMVGQDKVEFTLTFRQRQIRVPLSPQEKAEWLNAMTGRQFRQEQQVTDDLVFRIHSVWFPDPRVKKEWADKPNRPIEQQLNDIVAGLIAAAAVQREHRISQEEQARRRRERELERQKRQEAEEAEARRFEQLMKQVAQWRQANEIRAYVRAAKSRTRAARRRVSSGRLREWASWALRHADRIDPTASLISVSSRVRPTVESPPGGK